MKFFWKYLFPPLYGLFFYTILRLVSDLTNQYEFWHRSLRQNASDIIGTMLFSYLLVRVPHYFLRKFGTKTGRQQGWALFGEFGQILLVAMVLATVALVL